MWTLRRREQPSKLPVDVVPRTCGEQHVVYCYPAQACRWTLFLWFFLLWMVTAYLFLGWYASSSRTSSCSCDPLQRSLTSPEVELMAMAAPPRCSFSYGRRRCRRSCCRRCSRRCGCSCRCRCRCRCRRDPVPSSCPFVHAREWCGRGARFGVATGASRTRTDWKKSANKIHANPLVAAQTDTLHGPRASEWRCSCDSRRLEQPMPQMHHQTHRTELDIQEHSKRKHCVSTGLRVHIQLCRTGGQRDCKRIGPRPRNTSTATVEGVGLESGTRRLDHLAEGSDEGPRHTH